jgi:hypothetical protein
MQLEELLETDPESKIVDLYNTAHDSVWDSTGLNLEFYNRSTIRQAMLSAADRVSEFRLLVDSSVDWNQRKSQITWLAELLEKKSVAVRASREPLLHWLIVDETHFRLEKEHPKETIGKNNLIIRNAIKPLSDKLRDIWQQWWYDADTIR